MEYIIASFDCMIAVCVCVCTFYVYFLRVLLKLKTKCVLFRVDYDVTFLKLIKDETFEELYYCLWRASARMTHTHTYNRSERLKDSVNVNRKMA